MQTSLCPLRAAGWLACVAASQPEHCLSLSLGLPLARPLLPLLTATSCLLLFRLLLFRPQQMVPYKIIEGPGGDAWVEVSGRARRPRLPGSGWARADAGAAAAAAAASALAAAAAQQQRAAATDAVQQLTRSCSACCCACCAHPLLRRPPAAPTRCRVPRLPRLAARSTAPARLARLC